MMSHVKDRLISAVEDDRDLLIDVCARLVCCPTENPPSDTHEIASVVADILRNVDGAEVTFHTKADPVVNVVARVRGSKPGKRLIFNGHLDTFPAGDSQCWSFDPFSATIEGGRMYGRGVSDMKGGIACSMVAFILMAKCRELWAGEIVLTLCGDEETMGTKGAAHLLETVPDASGDAMISGDAGAPQVLRFGEKGLLWVNFKATGVSTHGAHVHKGKNAISALIEGLARAQDALNDVPILAPTAVTQAISESSAVSESLSGAGETRVLRSVTMNMGIINGGTSPNIVPAVATAACDIRLPAGVSTQDAEQALELAIDGIDGVTFDVVRRFEPTWSDVHDEIFPLITTNTLHVLNVDPAMTMRVGASDSRLYRSYRIPTVVCGLTPYNLGATDEYIEIEEMVKVSKIHLLTAFDFLSIQ